MCHNVRGGTTTQLEADVSEGLDVNKVRDLYFYQQSMASVQLMSNELHFKKSKIGSQIQRVVLTYGNIEEIERER